VFAYSRSVVVTASRSAPVGERLDIEAAVVDVTRRLVARFSPPLPASVVDRTVRACAARWQDVRLKEFVPLFVERRSVEHLRRLAARSEEPNYASSAEVSGDCRSSPSSIKVR
jgi:hypothetical protein